MPKRKIEGGKLGQLKRIPPALGSKAALRDPQVELDISRKAIDDDALTAISGALIKTLSHGSVTTKLEEIRLRDNKLTAKCLGELARVIHLAGRNIQDIDLGLNNISVSTKNEATLWEEFLRSFRSCSMLRRLDLSGNPLGPKAFEILAKVYAKEDQGTSEEGSKDVFGSRSVKGLENLSLKENRSNEGTIATPTLPRRRKDSTASVATRSDEMKLSSSLNTLHVISKGIRSIPYIILDECSMNDESALHLSFILEEHGLTAELNCGVPAARPGEHTRQLEAYDSIDGCNGIIWKPNSSLTEHGTKVLQLAEQARNTVGIDDSDNEEALVESPMAAPRKPSDTPVPFTPLSMRARRDSVSTAQSTPHTAIQRSLRSDPLRTARSKIQGNILRDSGPAAHDLWHAALKMLALARSLLLVSEEPEPEPQEHEDSPDGFSDAHRPETPVAEEQYMPFVRESSSEIDSPVTKDRLWPRLPAKPLETPPLPKPTVFKLGTNRHGRSYLQAEAPLSVVIPETDGSEPVVANIQPPKLYPHIPDKEYHSRLPKGLDEESWGRILAYATDASELLSESQQTQVVEYATQRSTLFRETESLGKPENTQIWKALDGMGCLAYK